MVCRVGDESHTKFWYDNWLGSSNLKSRYGRLFRLSTTPKVNICESGNWVGDQWEWNFRWRRHLFTWELDLSKALLDKLKSLKFLSSSLDSWEWRHASSKHYFVRSAYKRLTSSNYLIADNVEHSYSIWKFREPLKVITFAWRLFQDRIPLKVALSRRGISFHDSSGLLRSFCNDELETSTHLFSSCNTIYYVWQLLYNWLNVSVVLLQNPLHHYDYHVGMVSDRKGKKT
ncbi:hypothetical protein Lal_00019158 [Lupinus albus]|nr:hypothetical protein Lal_00019158 [Lupinus albus]